MDLIGVLEKDQELSNQSRFIYQQLSFRLKHLIHLYREDFQLKISDIDSNSDHSCGYIIKCHNNGYREFCNLPDHNHEFYLNERNHNEEHAMSPVLPKHTYQKKNINNIIDSQYQNGILTIENFVHEVTVSLISRLIIEWLIDHSTKIAVNYENGELLRKYDDLMLESPYYFRLNYLVDQQVIYYRLEHSEVETETEKLKSMTGELENTSRVVEQEDKVSFECVDDLESSIEG